MENQSNNLNEQSRLQEIVILDGKKISLQELNRRRATLEGNKKIVEVAPGQYRTLTRLVE